MARRNLCHRSSKRFTKRKKTSWFLVQAHMNSINGPWKLHLIGALALLSELIRQWLTRQKTWRQNQLSIAQGTPRLRQSRLITSSAHRDAECSMINWANLFQAQETTASRNMLWENVEFSWAKNWRVFRTWTCQEQAPISRTTHRQKIRTRSFRWERDLRMSFLGNWKYQDLGRM